jgi:hypothetical protein
MTVPNPKCPLCRGSGVKRGDTYCGCDLDHDLDYDRIIEMSDKQGHYDNGWQFVLIWCCTHNRVEPHWIDYDLVLMAAGRPLENFLAARTGKRAA